MHGGNPVYVNGQAAEGDVVPLGPGSVATAKVKLANPGIWLIHCHLVFHADAGMVTLVIAE
jgi:FtsP/CotA-like multicopper oxidase with cupredoxin domain